jgi:glycosyltransferase involved in cell wall biosynthesis
MSKQFLYLVQGRKANVLKYQALQSTESDLVVATFDEEVWNDEMPVLKSFFIPKTTWAEGRNIQYEFAKSLTNNYDYYIFLDDDVVFESGSFVEFQQLLLKYKPAIGFPLMDVAFKRGLYDVNTEVQHIQVIDQQFQAYSATAFKNSITMPLVTDFDSESWWYACEINSYLLFMENVGSLAQFNQMRVVNVGHVWNAEAAVTYESDSIYRGGVTEKGLEQVRQYVRSKFTNTPAFKYSLFHLNGKPKINRKQLSENSSAFILKCLLSFQFKKALKAINLQIKTGFNSYPEKLIIRKTAFKTSKL